MSYFEASKFLEINCSLHYSPCRSKRCWDECFQEQDQAPVPSQSGFFDIFIKVGDSINTQTGLTIQQQHQKNHHRLTGSTPLGLNCCLYFESETCFQVPRPTQISPDQQNMHRRNVTNANKVVFCSFQSLLNVSFDKI